MQNARYLEPVLLVFAVAAAACSPIVLVAPYDEQMDSRLMSLYGDTAVFVDRMIAKHGTPEGTFAANLDFYQHVDAQLAGLAVRAEAHRVLGDCPAEAVAAKVLSSLRVEGNVAAKLADLPKDDCDVQLIALLRSGYDDMEALHREQGDLGIPTSARGALLDGGVGSMLRVAITVQIAKRNDTGTGRGR